MDNQPRPPIGSNRQSTNDMPTGPAPLDKFDFDKDLDSTPAVPGPLLHQQVAGKPANKGKTVVMILLTVLLLAAVAAAGYFYWQTMEAQKQADAAHVLLQATNVENTKLKLAAQEATITPIAKEPTAAEKLAADKTAITDVLTAKLHSPTKQKDAKLSINISKQNEEFAYASAGVDDGNGGGFMGYILKKVKDEWVIIYSGQNKVSNAEVEAYTIPTDFQSGQ